MGIYLHGESSIWCKHGNSFLCLLIIISGTLNLKEKERKREENNNKNINNCLHFHSYCQIQKRFFSTPLFSSLHFLYPNLSQILGDWIKENSYSSDCTNISVFILYLGYLFYSCLIAFSFLSFFTLPVLTWNFRNSLYFGVTWHLN